MTGFEGVEGLIERAETLAGSEPVRALELAAKAVAAVEPEGEYRLRLLARAHLATARCHSRLGEFEAGLEGAREGLALLRRLDDAAGVVQAHTLLGSLHFDRGDLTSSAEAYRNGLAALSEHESDDGERVHLLFCLGDVLLEAGETSEASSCAERALGIARAGGIRRAESKILGLAGDIHFARGEFTRALSIHREQLRVAQEFGERTHEGLACCQIARVQEQIGDHPAALRRYEQGAAIFREQGANVSLAVTLGNLAFTHVRLGAHDEALRYAREALALGRELGHKRIEADSLRVLSMVQEKAGDLAAALENANRALAIHRERGAKPGVEAACARVGHIQYLLGELDDAEASLEEALALARDTGDRLGECGALHGLADVYVARSDYDAACEQLAAAEPLAKELGDHQLRAKIHETASRAHAGRHEFEQALAHLRRHLELEQTRRRRESEARIERLRVAQEVAQARHEAEEAGERASRRAAVRERAIIDHTPHVAVHGYDRKGIIRLWNAAAATIFGWESGEMVGRKAERLFPNAAAYEGFEEALRRMEVTGASLGPEEWSFKTRAGETGFCETTLFPIVGHKGERMFVRMDVNITPRKMAEAKAREFLRELAHIERVAMTGELAASIAHEINQPLCAITTNSQVVRRLLDAPETDAAEVREAVADITADAQRAGEIIRRLRELVRRRAIEHAAVDVNNLVENTVELMHSEALGRRVDLRLDLKRELPAVRGDGIQIQQVVMNLVRNGFEAMGDGAGEREVVVSTTHDADAVTVRVSDRGPGLADSARLFEPFYSTKREGLGMGLAISKSIVEAHSGTIRARNNPQGGATVEFTLPVA